ncbi:putative N-acetylated-alpha-linked acidic dipeptidase [Rhopilema esculentum]|uniref:putative N-acetylated-alpha-linked acidic dipeptidase n=1 Tax=Rhopilema esculentum TaxID=499914 RepID=UPI0031DBEEE0
MESINDDENVQLMGGLRHRKRLWKARIFLLFAMMILFGIAFVAGFFLERSIKTRNDSSKESGTGSDYAKFHDMVKNEMGASNIKENLMNFTSVQHIAGSDDDAYQAKQFIFKKWAEYLGKENVELKKYNVLLSYPEKPGKISIVDGLSGNLSFTTHAYESRLWKDEFVKNVAVPFNAYAAAKHVEGKLVYINYGTAKDFEYLKKLNISCKGRILIARYGKNFRANKVALGEAAGAIGMILYTDPADYASGTSSYPKSWWMPPDGVQRGTVQLGDGDPLTPGYPSTDHAFRINESDAILPRIPVQPISYQDALPFISLLDGVNIPENWKDWIGGLETKYRITMSENNTRVVRLEVNTKRERRDIYNVIATVKGSVEPDRIVVLGNHHDAWVMGAVDPSSGSSTLMEIIRAVGVAVKKGWRPRRTLMFCNWDGEEYGLVGSTEWVEDYASMLKSTVVAYLNSDSSVHGNYSIDVKGSDQLANMVFEAARQVKDPDDESKSVYEDWRKSFPDKAQPFYPRIRSPGAGSDHKNFYTRFGIPVVDIRYTYNWDDYNHAMSYPVYHSLHDSFHWMTSFVDPKFSYHLALGRIWAQMGMTLADSELLPFNFTRLAWKLSRCKDSLETKYGQALKLQGISLDDLQAQIRKFAEAAESFHVSLHSLDRKSDLQVRMANDQMMQVERSFLSTSGLPGRPLMKNVVFAPSAHDQYSGSCFPGVADAMYQVIQNNEDDWSVVKQQLTILSHHVLQAARALSR